ncbi:MAG: nucleotidyltransferase substrate binding protein [Planctomycetia bacterium]
MASGELGYDNLQRALRGFEQALSLDGSGYPDFVRDVLDNGRIKKFEYCVELFWKYLRSCLIAEGRDVPNSPRGAIKAALDRGFILEAEYQPALDMFTDRNTCSHIYKQALIPVIIARLPAHAAVMQAIAARLPTT